MTWTAGANSTFPTAEEWALGEALLQAVWQSQQWCFRKVDSLELLDGARARRRVSLDCLPYVEPKLAYDEAERGRTWKRQVGEVVYPLGMLKKGVAIRSLDTAGPNGQLPVLTAEENGRFASLMLAARLRDELRSAGTAFTHSHWDVAFRIASERDPAKAAHVVADEFSQFAVSNYLADLATDLALNYLFLVLVPRDQVGTRTILKYAVDWHAVHQPQSRVEEFGLRLRSWTTSCGFTSYPFPLEVGDPHWASSYHLEARLQRPLRAVSLRLPPAQDGLDGRIDHGNGTVVHVTGTFPDPVEGTAELRIGVGHESIRMVAALVALFTAVVFQLTQWLPGGRDALQAASDGAVAILLAAPAVAIVLLAGVGENHLAVRLLRPLRVIAMASAFTLVAGAASLVGYLHEPWITRFWTLGQWAWTLVAVILWAGVWWTGHRIKSAVRRGKAQ